ncbi:MAG: hypothetical protein JSW71_16965 [Gemmatimonadota bacterium]|nr:MAG: hypothetical protein JSW71_16965 [Gemmatimonadota bacterium]
MDIKGARMASVRMPGFGRDQAAGFFEDIFGDQVWFIPSSLGDRIQIMGLPDEDALHPFARGAQRFYRYQITDSLRITYSDRTIRAIRISVEPRDQPDLGEAVQNPLSYPWSDILGRVRQPTMISGGVWIDADSLDVVRLTASFVGAGIWDPEDDAPELVSLEADIEYSLHQSRFWLPLRQILSVNWIFKYLPGANLPGEAVTTFSDFEIDLERSEVVFTHDPLEHGVTGRRFGSWQCPDPWDFDQKPEDYRCGSRPTSMVGIGSDGGRWEINLPTRDSLESYDFSGEWSRATRSRSDNVIASRMTEMAELSEASQASQTQRQRFGSVGWKHAYELFRYNRVQGPSVGGSHAFSLPPAFTTLRLQARYGFGDQQFVAAGTWRRDSPSGRFDVAVFRLLRELEPWTNGTGLGNSVKALILGHDDADYYRAAWGTGVEYISRTGWFRNGQVVLEYERQETVAVQSSSPVAGDFQPNPPITDGTYARGRMEKTWTVGFAGTTRFTLGGEGLFSRHNTSGRFWGAARLPYRHDNILASLQLRGGLVAGDDLIQMRYRLGGPETVRGYDYGVNRGRAFWSTQADLELAVSQWWSPTVFVDVADIDFTGTPLVGIGAGIFLFSGWIEAALAKGMTNQGRVRFDIYVQVPMN